jgi:hypothetical protein
MGHVVDNLEGKIADAVKDITDKTGDLNSGPDDKAVDIAENAGGMKAGLTDSVGELRDNTEQVAREAADKAQSAPSVPKDSGAATANG